MNIVFDYPSDWTFPSDTERGNSYFHMMIPISIPETDTTGTENMYFFGYTDDHIFNGPAQYCQKNIDEFCRYGCEKLDNGVAIDFRLAGTGDTDLVAFAFTSLNHKYPRTCFMHSLSSIVSEIALAQGLNYTDALFMYDFKFMIINREFNDSLMLKVDNFRKFAESIRLK